MDDKTKQSRATKRKLTDDNFDKLINEGPELGEYYVQHDPSGAEQNLAHELETAHTKLGVIERQLRDSHGPMFKDKHPNPVYLKAFGTMLDLEAHVNKQYKTFFDQFKSLQATKKAVSDKLTALKDGVKADYLASRAQYTTTVQKVAGLDVEKKVPLPKIGGLSVVNRQVFKYPDNEAEVPHEIKVIQAAAPDKITTFQTRKTTLDKRKIEALLKDMPELASELHVFPTVQTSVAISPAKVQNFIAEISFPVLEEEKDD